MYKRQLEYTPVDKPRDAIAKNILQMLLCVDGMMKQNIVTALKKDGISVSTIDRALSDLRRSGRVLANYNGVYGNYASRAKVDGEKRKREKQRLLNEEHNGGAA